MLGKKLLTLLCALGILASGACFGPVHYTPPPPPAIAGEGLKRVRIVVVNQAESHHLDTLALGMVIARRFEEETNLGIGARMEGQPSSDEDGVLQVKIFSETAILQSETSSSGIPSWKCQIEASVSLILKSGQTVWRGKQVVETFKASSYAHQEDAMWKDPLVQSAILSRLGNILAYRAIQQNPQDTDSIETAQTPK